MSDYFLKTDPALPRAIAEGAWDSFLKALSETTPEVMESLKDGPLGALRAVAEEYKRVCSYEFGAITCYEGGPRLNMNPLSDLAFRICSPSIDKPRSDWPPSVAFWEPAMQGVIFTLSGAIREWGRHFVERDRKPSFRMISVALDTMGSWIAEPTTMTLPHWIGHAKVIMRHRIQTPQLNVPVNWWNPTEETELDFRTRIKGVIKELDTWSKTHIKETKPQFVKYDTKRNSEHYHWAALRLVREITYPEIADRWAQLKPEGNALDEGTVRKGVRAALKLLDLRDARVDRK